MQKPNENSKASNDGYYYVFSSEDKARYIAMTGGGLPLSLAEGHKQLLKIIGVDWMAAECKNVEFFYKGKGLSIKEFLNGI